MTTDAKSLAEANQEIAVLIGQLEFVHELFNKVRLANRTGKKIADAELFSGQVQVCKVVDTLTAIDSKTNDLRFAAKIAFDQWRTYMEMHEQDDLESIKHSEADHYRQWLAKLQAFDKLAKGEM